MSRMGPHLLLWQQAQTQDQENRALATQIPPIQLMAIVMEPIVFVTTEDNILNPGASPFVLTTVEDQPLEDPPPGDFPIQTAEDPGTDPPEDVLPTGDENRGITDNAGPVGPVAGITTRSGRVIHPPDRLISNPVWAQVQRVLWAWLGD